MHDIEHIKELSEASNLSQRAVYGDVKLTILSKNCLTIEDVRVQVHHG